MFDLFSTKIAHAASVDAFLGKLEYYILNPLIYLMFAVAILIFLYGVVEFLLSQSSEEKKTTGKQHMIWGIIGLTIMLGVFSIMNFVLNTIGVKYIHPSTGKVDQLPPINVPNSLK